MKNCFLIHIPSILHGVMVGVGSPWPKHIPTSLDFVKLLNGCNVFWGKLNFVNLLNGCNVFGENWILLNC
jgi:hypothetical protein